MKRVIIFIVKFTAVLTIIAYCVYCNRVVDLTGVFNVDKNFRNETKFIVIHHDDIFRDCSLLEIEIYHRDTCGYEITGFAYNIYIKDGKVYIVHNLDTKGAHTKGYNSQTIGVCIHSADRDKLSTKILLILTVKFLMIKYGLSKEFVKGHCDLNDTKCPEINLENLKKWL